MPPKGAPSKSVSMNAKPARKSTSTPRAAPTGTEGSGKGGGGKRRRRSNSDGAKPKDKKAATDGVQFTGSTVPIPQPVTIEDITDDVAPGATAEGTDAPPSSAPPTKPDPVSPAPAPPTSKPKKRVRST